MCCYDVIVVFGHVDWDAIIVIGFLPHFDWDLYKAM
jgi:hypothetical protein